MFSTTGWPRGSACYTGSFVSTLHRMRVRGTPGGDSRGAQGSIHSGAWRAGEHPLGRLARRGASTRAPGAQGSIRDAGMGLPTLQLSWRACGEQGQR